jgi:thiopurine S-methyltransferase
MDAYFWIDAWIEGRTAFHQSTYNDKLLQYFPTFSAGAGQSVLVPLCGKTRDLRWLRDQGPRVHGVELYEAAVRAFFPENDFPAPTLSRDADFTHYEAGGVVISCGDFFRLEAPESYDFVYDRAALVALPELMRPGYVNNVLRSLRRGGKCLLIAYEYDPAELQGPPFSVVEAEVSRLYGTAGPVTLLERRSLETANSRLATVPSLRETVYVIEKTR